MRLQDPADGSCSPADLTYDGSGPICQEVDERGHPGCQVGAFGTRCLAPSFASSAATSSVATVCVMPRLVQPPERLPGAAGPKKAPASGVR